MKKMSIQFVFILLLVVLATLFFNIKFNFYDQILLLCNDHDNLDSLSFKTPSGDFVMAKDERKWRVTDVASKETVFADSKKIKIVTVSMCYLKFLDSFKILPSEKNKFGLGKPAFELIVKGDGAKGDGVVRLFWGDLSADGLSYYVSSSLEQDMVYLIPNGFKEKMFPTFDDIRNPFIFRDLRGKLEIEFREIKLTADLGEEKESDENALLRKMILSLQYDNFYDFNLSKEQGFPIDLLEFPDAQLKLSRSDKVINFALYKYSGKYFLQDKSDDLKLYILNSYAAAALYKHLEQSLVDFYSVN